MNESTLKEPSTWTQEVVKEIQEMQNLGMRALACSRIGMPRWEGGRLCEIDMDPEGGKL